MSKTNKSPVECFGVDDGYFSIKIVNEQGECFTIPSRASYDVIMGNVNPDDDKSFIFETDGRKYTVDAHLPEPLDTRSLSTIYPLSAVNRVLVHAGLLSAGMGGKDVAITTGLPVKDYFLPTTAKNEELINKKVESLEAKVHCGINNQIPTANIVSNRVASEGIAGFIDQIYTLDGKLTENATALMEGITAIIDIGGQTTDCAVILPGMKIDMRRSGSASIGALYLQDSVQRQIAALLRTSPSSVTIRQTEMAIEKGYLLVSREKVDVAELVAQEKLKLFDQIIMAVLGIMGSDADIENLIFIGGGTIVFESNIHGRFKGCIIPEEPQYANARGMLKLTKLANQ